MESIRTSCQAKTLILLRQSLKEKIILCGLALLSFFSPVQVRAQSVFTHGNVIVSPSGHALQFEDGTPFFWLGDTGWEMLHRLNAAEIKRYFDNRAAKGFNVIQTALLAEFSGLTKPDQEHNLPLMDNDPAKPNEKYFLFVDKVVELAHTKGLFLGLLPTWGDKVTPNWGAGPVVFDPDNAYTYGLFLGKRYQNAANILWILGGDRPAMKGSSDWRPIWRAMAKGLRDGAGHKAFITYHPSGGPNSTSQFLKGESWLSMNMIQSGHGGGHDVATWEFIKRDYDIMPAKPVIDAEPNYEDHPVNPWPKWDPRNGYYRAYDVRKQLYRSVFSGACGVTYGHHSVWQFYSPREEKVNFADRFWPEALDRPGAYQAGYLRRLIESRPYLNRIPDESLIITGQGEKGAHMSAFRDSAGTYLMVYSPLGTKFSVSTTSLKGSKLESTWYDPRKGEYLSRVSINNTSPVDFTPPKSGVNNDWVLILDSVN